MTSSATAPWTSTISLVHCGKDGPVTHSIGGPGHGLSQYIDLLEKLQITFQSLHVMRHGGGGAGPAPESDTRSALVHASMQYIADLAAYRDDTRDPVIQSRIRICESIMMLAHAVFILPHQCVSRQIVKWASFHNAPGHGRVSGSIWRSIHKCILGGYISQAIRLIKEEGDRPDPVQSLLISLLESIPLLDPCNTSLTCSQFDHVFDLFRLRSDQFIAHVQSVHDPELMPIAKTLHGDVTSILDSVRDLCPDNWLYGLSGLLLFSNPTATKSDLSDIVAICVQVQTCEIPYQDCISEIICGDVSCSLVAVYYQIHISWLVAHLADLFQLSGHTISNMIGNQLLRTRFIFEYGSELISDVNLWHIAPSYLMTCGNSGLQLIRSCVLEHVHDEFTAEKCIDLCTRLQLHDEIVSICKQMASRSLTRSCPESAILWELRGNDPSAASDIVDVMVREFIQSSGQVLYSTFILEELISACKEPPSSLLSLCIAVQIMSTRDLDQRLRGAINFLHRGDVHNHDLDVVIGGEAARILMNRTTEEPVSIISPDDVIMLMTLLYTNESVSTHLNRVLSHIILQPSAAAPLHISQ